MSKLTHSGQRYAKVACRKLLKNDFEETLIYQRVMVRSGISDDFFIRFFSKPSEPTELQNQELIENSELFVTRQK